MRQIVDGIEYNPETATLVASYLSGDEQGDSRYYEEDLYITEDGTWFIVGSGNAKTGYATSNGHGSTWGSMLCPLTPAEAMGWLVAWLEEHDGIASIMEHVGDNLVDP